VIADRIMYDVRYSQNKLLPGIAVVSMSITYLQFRNEVCFWCRKSAADACQLFIRSLCFLAKRYIVEHKCLNSEEVNRKSPHRNKRPHYTTVATLRADRQTTV